VRWRANPRARYYNVQLFRGRSKRLSIFPSTPSAVIAGRLLRTTGTYRLLVWSGVGAKRLGRYQRQPWINKTLVVRRGTTPAPK
jgi:hypothetical protein